MEEDGKKDMMGMMEAAPMMDPPMGMEWKLATNFTPKMIKYLRHSKKNHNIILINIYMQILL